MWRVILGYFIGVIFTGILSYIHYTNTNKSKSVNSRYKPTIDYRLEGNGKQIDTIWIYNFKKH